MTFMRCLAWLTLCALCACPIQAETPPKKGPIADKIYFNVKMKPEIGLKDAAEGLTDIFFFGVDGPVIFGLEQATRDKLDLYVAPGGSWPAAVGSAVEVPALPVLSTLIDSKETPAF